MTDELITRLASLSAPCREMDDAIALAIGWTNLLRKNENVTVGRDPSGQYQFSTPRYTASIDAAMSLVPSGFAFGCSQGTNEPDVEGWAWCGPDEGPYAFAPTPAIALCIAAIRARASNA